MKELKIDHPLFKIPSESLIKIKEIFTKDSDLQIKSLLKNLFVTNIMLTSKIKQNNEEIL